MPVPVPPPDRPAPAALGRAVHALSRIGDELYLEPTGSGVRGRAPGRGRTGAAGRGGPGAHGPLPPPQLSLRAASPSRSAFASFLLAPLFFQLYQPGAPAAPPRCKVHMKVSDPR